MTLPITVITPKRASAQIAVVVAAMLIWVLVSSTLGLGLVGRSRLAPPLHVALTGLVALALVFVATLGDADRSSALGLARPKGWPTALMGTVGAIGTYLVTILVTGAAMLALGGLKDVEAKARALRTLGELPLWAIAPTALFAGFYEEVLFRGFLLGRLRIVLGGSFLGLAASVAVSSALFASGHVYQGKLGLVQTFTAGVCLGVLAVARRSIWPSIFAHAAIDLFGLFALHVLQPTLENLLRREGLAGFG